LALETYQDSLALWDVSLSPGMAESRAAGMVGDDEVDAISVPDWLKTRYNLEIRERAKLPVINVSRGVQKTWAKANTMCAAVERQRGN
jgi:hypothetical protein